MSLERITEDQQERVLSVRLSLAHAWVGFLQRAYDALLHHGINYRTLREYQDKERLLDAALDKHGTLEQGRERIMLYIERLHSAITAAVRRKTFKPV